VWKGSCQCEGVQFVVDAVEPLGVNCYCTICRKISGSPFASVVSVKREAFRIEKGRELLAKYNATPGFDRWHCSKCFSPVYGDVTSNQQTTCSSEASYRGTRSSTIAPSTRHSRADPVPVPGSGAGLKGALFMAASRLYLPVVVGALMGCGGAPSASPPAPATVLVASQVPAAASGTDTHGSPAGMTAQQAATQFWVRLGRRDCAGAVVLATYPFDLDGHDGCVGSAAELEQAFVDKPLPADQELVVGRTRLIDERGSGLGPM
jgi:hypothetical protein